MFEIEIYNLLRKQKLRGLPLREPAQRRIYNTASGLAPGDAPPKENPFSLMADRANAVKVQRRIEEMISVLKNNGVAEDVAKDQANQLLQGLSYDVIATIKENQAAQKSVITKEVAKSDAVKAIDQKMGQINEKLNEMSPAEIARIINELGASYDRGSFFSSDTAKLSRSETAIASGIPEEEPSAKGSAGDEKTFRAGTGGDILEGNKLAIMQDYERSGDVNIAGTTFEKHFTISSKKHPRKILPGETDSEYDKFKKKLRDDHDIRYDT